MRGCVHVAWLSGGACAGANSQALENFSWDYAPVLSDNRDQSIQFSGLKTTQLVYISL